VLVAARRGVAQPAASNAPEQTRDAIRIIVVTTKT
jgi:hypothetical protein